MPGPSQGLSLLHGARIVAKAIRGEQLDLGLAAVHLRSVGPKVSNIVSRLARCIRAPPGGIHAGCNRRVESSPAPLTSLAELPTEPAGNALEHAPALDLQ